MYFMSSKTIHSLVSQPPTSNSDVGKMVPLKVRFQRKQKYFLRFFFSKKIFTVIERLVFIFFRSNIYSLFKSIVYENEKSNVMSFIFGVQYALLLNILVRKKEKFERITSLTAIITNVISFCKQRILKI